MSSLECIGCRTKNELGFCPPRRKQSGISIILNQKVIPPEGIARAESLLRGVRQDSYRYPCPRRITKAIRPLHRRVSRLRTRMNRAGRVPQVAEMQY